MMDKYVYVASSWRNHYHIAVCAALKSAGVDHYDFKHEGFAWSQVEEADPSQWGYDKYVEILDHPRSIEGFKRDFDAMQRATHFVLVLPCGRSAHLEAGWAIGQGKPTAIYIPEFDGPDLMYKMADYITDSMFDLLGWLGVED